MIKSQFIIIGILSFIAVIGTISTLSYAYAEVKASDILGLADQGSNVASGSDIGAIADNAKPDLSALKDFGDKFASIPSTTDLLNSLNKQTASTG
jgi:hypothetical protein